MIVVENKIIPFGGYAAITLFPFIFVREGRGSEVTMNHERIHGRQQIEMLLIPFFLLYVVEWAVKLFVGNGNAYRRISFEREAYENEEDMSYLSNRKPYAWIKYMFN